MVSCKYNSTDELILIPLRMAGFTPSTVEYNALIASCINNAPPLHEKAYDVYKGMKKVMCVDMVMLQGHEHGDTCWYDGVYKGMTKVMCVDMRMCDDIGVNLMSSSLAFLNIELSS